MVSFSDDVAGAVVALPDAIRAEDTRVAPNSELGKYLSRPVNIATYTWSVGGNVDQTFSPWQLFMNHTSIKKKLDNYYLFRGNLHVKFILNASPFYYGCAMACYNPLSSFRSPEINFTKGQPNVNLSQLPHIFIYPSVSQGGSMKLPFVYHKEWLNLTSNTDVTNMGTMYLRTLYNLQNANGATNNINVQVYAWVEDVELSGPTIGLALQSGKSDEYGKGPVSKPAGAIARAAGQLKDIPIIGPYATATSMIASKIGQAASLFGYTNVPVIDDVHSYKIDPFPKMAATDIGTSIDKLTLDAKNELTIDPKVCGADFGDEMAISSIATRESLLTNFDWTQAALAGDKLFNIAVIPSLQRYTVDTSQVVLNLTPMSLVGKAFNLWRGDIEVRFKVICSQYHRGRLRFSWDPIASAISTTDDTTTEVYTKIVDIAEATDITMRIPYMQQTAWLNVGDITLADSTYFGTGNLTNDPRYNNGILTVRVLTELTAPINSSDIKILVFVKGADNLEFANPRTIDSTGRLAPFTVQSGLLAYDNEEEQISSIALKPSTASPHIDLIYNGETVKSIRTLIRRANLNRSFSASKNVGATQLLAINRSYFSRLPIYPGFDPNGVNNATAPIAAATRPYSFVPYSYMNWFGQCYLGCRGSVNWQVLGHNPSLYAATSISRQNSSAILSRSFYNYLQSGSVNIYTTQSNMAIDGMSGCAGLQLTHNRTNSSNAAVIPFYSQYKFRQFTPSDTTLGSSVDGSTQDGVVFDQYVANGNATTTNTNFYLGNFFSTYCSAGTDFTYIFFLAVPTLYYYNAVPAAQTDP